MMEQKVDGANSEYEMSRAKTCADNYKNGFRFKAGTPMALLCSDIEIIEPTNLEHVHKIKN